MTGKLPPARALQETIELLASRAVYDGEQEGVFTRIAPAEGGLYIDLGDRDWRAIRVVPSGWSIVKKPKVRFRRRKGMLPLPHPERHGDVSVLRTFINIANENEWMLCLGWLLGTFMPRGPYPILLMQGEHGSAKTTTARILRSLIDPSVSPVRARPRNEQDLMIAGSNSWVMAYDNLSGLRPDLADSLCRISTGGGFSARQLYSDEDEKIFDISRPILLTGIDALATREDLVDRSILLTMPPIDDSKRVSEEALWADFEQSKGVIFGGLLDTLVALLRDRGSVELPKSPRMADFAKWVSAAERHLGWASESFLNAYNENRATLIKDAAENDPLVAVLVEFLSAERRNLDRTHLGALERPHGGRWGAIDVAHLAAVGELAVQ